MNSIFVFKIFFCIIVDFHTVIKNNISINTILPTPRSLSGDFLPITQYHNKEIGIEIIHNLIYLISFTSIHLCACVHLTLCNVTIFVDSCDHQHSQDTHFHHKVPHATFYSQRQFFSPYRLST